MVDARALEPFDWSGPVLSEPGGFVVRPSAAGGFEACAAALSRLLIPRAAHLDDGQRTALRELGWGDPVPNLSGGDDIQPRNHTRSWPIEQLPLACRHTLLTLAVVYGFHEDDPLQVSLDPFA